MVTDRLSIAVKAHKEGQEAFEAGIPISMNPYVERDTDYTDESYLLYRNWENGWHFSYIQALMHKKVQD